MLIIYVSISLLILFEKINQNVLGIYFFIIAGLILAVLACKYILANFNKSNWQEIETNSINYVAVKRLALEEKNSQTIQRLQFSAQYSVNNINYTKKFFSVFPLNKIEKITQIIDKKQNGGKFKAFLYYNTHDPSKTIFQQGLTYFGLIFSLNIVVTELFWNLIAVSLVIVMITGVSTYLKEGYMQQIIPYLIQTPVGYIIILNMVVIIVFTLLVIILIMKTGLKQYIAYPWFYDQENEIKVDFIKELHNLSQICSNCGEIIEKKDKYCPRCGLEITPNYVKKEYSTV